VTTIVMFAALSLQCPPLVKINESMEAWVAVDVETEIVAKRRCGELYPASPCLTKFIKRDTRVYWAICSAPQKDTK